jgi:drug/metabolite transporter (DMT)-like permease
VIGIVGGLGAALMWGTATLCTSRSSRQLGAASVLSWVMLTGLVIVLPLAIAGVMNVIGLALVYEALRIGKVGIVSPVASTEGAIAAVIAILTGETLGVPTGLLLVLITLGIVLASRPAEQQEHEDRHPLASTLMAVGAAVTFGVGLYSSGHVSDLVPAVWVILPARVMGVAFVALPVALRRRLRLTRESAPLVAAAGICEIVGLACYAVGSRHGIAITAVLASQFAAVAAIGAYVLFHERLSAVQRSGAFVILLGVAALTALNA